MSINSRRRLIRVRNNIGLPMFAFGIALLAVASLMLRGRL